MPRASRRRRRAAGRRRLGRPLLLAAAATVVIILVADSFAQIHAQSSGEQSGIDQAYGTLATRLVGSSNATGARLATLLASAPTLQNQQEPVVISSRAQLQQGLDQALAETSAQATQAEELAKPAPSGDVGASLASVLEQREAGTAAIRSALDGLLGLESVPPAGSPTAATPAAPTVLLSEAQAGDELTRAGNRLAAADAGYRLLLATVRVHRFHVHLPPSVWLAPSRGRSSPLRPEALAELADVLADQARTPAMVPFHRVVITTVGLSPAAVPVPSGSSTATAGPGTASSSCNHPTSLEPGASPTVLPPTGSVTALLTVSNCGTVTESGLVVTATVALADPAGTAPAPGPATSSWRTTVTIASGGSIALTSSPLPVATGHRYQLRLAVGIPSGQQSSATAGLTQDFLLQITACRPDPTYFETCPSPS